MSDSKTRKERDASRSILHKDLSRIVREEAKSNTKMNLVVKGSGGSQRTYQSSKRGRQGGGWQDEPSTKRSRCVYSPFAARDFPSGFSPFSGRRIYLSLD